MTTGGCLCGKVTYSFDGEPAVKALCHCTQCQKLTGTAFTYNLFIPRGSFRITSGTPKTNDFTQEIGMELNYSFCPDCATVLYKQSEDETIAPFYLVQAGTVDAGFLGKTKPEAELWLSRKAGWLVPVEGTGQKPQF